MNREATVTNKEAIAHRPGFNCLILKESWIKNWKLVLNESEISSQKKEDGFRAMTAIKTRSDSGMKYTMI